MSQLLKRSEFPTLSADPQQQVVDHGFPLYRFKDPSRHIKLFQENQVISRTNDYKPTPFTLKRQLKPKVKISRSIDPKSKDYNKADFLEFLSKDIEMNREFEQFDPLKGNSLVVTDYLDGFELYLLSAGPSLSNLVILTSKKASYDTGHYQVSLSLDQMTIRDTIDLEYPIRQIHLSPLSNLFKKTFIVRTTSSLHLFKIDEKQQIKLIHQFILPKRSALFNTKINYSMPIHVELSPFYEFQYLFVTNNGYHALIDGSNDKTIFENVDPIPENINYKSSWKSCGFGKTPSTIYITSPECIKEFIVRDKDIQSKVLAAPNDRIVAFKTASPLLYCFATIDAIVVMDRLLPERPVVTWLHKMRDSPPSEIMIDKLVDNKWRITAFSQSTQRYTMMHFKYVNEPSKGLKPMIKILEIYNFTLPILKCEEVFNYTSRINSMGSSLKCNGWETHDTTQGNVFFSTCRLFEDGSMRVQYMALETEIYSIQVLKPCPKYQLLSLSPQFEQLLSEMQAALQFEKQGIQKNQAEVCDLDMKHFRNYLKNDVTTGSEKLTEKTKLEIAEKVRDLKSTTTFRDLFEDEEYQNYTLEELTDFLEEMEVYEQIERARQIDIPGVFHPQGQTPSNTFIRAKLKQAHEKKIRLSSLMIRPLRDTVDTFQYLNNDAKFNSTTTTRVLAGLWSVDDSRFDSIVFPEYNTSSVPGAEKFPSISIYKRKREPEALPSISFSSADDPPEIPMPVVAASQPKKAKKSSSGATQIVPIILSDDEEDDIITPKKLARSIVSTSLDSASTQISSQDLLPPPSSTFTNTATQPLPGAFASRAPTKKPVVAKKKKSKPKTSGFK